MSEPFNTYLQECRDKLATGLAREHAYRPSLEHLLQALQPELTVINDPARIACGAPDYILLQGDDPLGYIEAKDMGDNLAETSESEQVLRYRLALGNFMLTNYLDFYWFVGGELRGVASLGRKQGQGIVVDKEGETAVSQLLSQFFSQEVEPLATAEALAERMAHLARLMKKAIVKTLEQEGEKVFHAQQQAFQKTLLPDLTSEEFANMYSETLTYGLFSARVRFEDIKGEALNRDNASRYLPSTNPFLADFFYQLSGRNMPQTISWLVDDLIKLLRRADIQAILRQFKQHTHQEDPIVHFYETFLQKYDPKLRKERAVYFTPKPVISYIVRSLDAILQTRFNRPLGLADPETLILDPAAGTGAFLYFVIQQIYDKLHSMGQAGSWNSYVQQHLLPRLFGFELLMASYAVAHLNLELLLRELGYTFNTNERLNIFFTNTLSEPKQSYEVMGFANFLSDEGSKAAEVKQDKPIMVVLGNPPYSVSSLNNNDYIDGLMNSYKKAVRTESNIQPLNDDYIKFIRFAHNRIEKTGHGVVALITNNSYLFGLVHRGVREELLKTFHTIYIFNLHGSALVSLKADKSTKDENIFDIQQAVTITLLVKEKRALKGYASVHYAELWGNRKTKYEQLFAHQVQNQNWTQLSPVSPFYFFVPKNFELQEEYEELHSLAQLFSTMGTAVESRKDGLLIRFTEQELLDQLHFFISSTPDQIVTQLKKVKSTKYWKIEEIQEVIAQEKPQKFIAPILYRPFDWRHIYYNTKVIPRSSHSYPTLKHMLKPNLGLIVSRQITHGNFYDSVWVTNCLAEKKVGNSTRSSSIVPLYLYNGFKPTQNQFFMANQNRQPNLAPAFIKQAEARLGLTFVVPDEVEIQPPTPAGSATFTPEDIFYYAYAIFHSPTYRGRYAEFLKVDFPRLPLTADVALFQQLAHLGYELVQLHLLSSPAVNQLQTSFPKAGSNEVKSPHYSEASGRVYINSTQYFEGVAPELWQMTIGGYKPLEKWLKDRGGRVLSFEELYHYQQMVVALAHTQRLMQEIDTVIPGWPLA